MTSISGGGGSGGSSSLSWHDLLFQMRPLSTAITVYVFCIVLLFIIKPLFAFTRRGNPKQFGTQCIVDFLILRASNRKKKNRHDRKEKMPRIPESVDTILPFWILPLVIAICAYILVYYLELNFQHIKK